MIRLAFDSPGAAPRSVTFEGDVVRFGSRRGIQVWLAGPPGSGVAPEHGEFVRERGTYMIVARDPRCRLWVDGRAVKFLTLRGGERIRVGSLDGPEIRVLDMGNTGPIVEPGQEEATVRVTPEQLAQMRLQATARPGTAPDPRIDADAPPTAPSVTRLAPAPTRASSGVARPSSDVARASSGVARASSGVARASSDVARDSSDVTRASSDVTRASSDVTRAPSDVTRAERQGAVPGPQRAGAELKDALPSPQVAPPERQAAGSVGASTLREAAVDAGAPAAAVPDAAAPLLEAPRTPLDESLPSSHSQLEVKEFLLRARQEIEEARSRTSGQSSGQTMVIMAEALAGIRETAALRVGKRSHRKLVFVLAASLTTVLLLSGIIWFQQRQITTLVTEKLELDAQIQQVLAQMDSETDENRLGELDAQLELLMGDAAEKVIQVRRASAKKGEELVQPVDELEADIRKILRSFNAETYAIPPIFRRALKEHVDELQASPSLRSAYERKLRHWPQIQRALRRKQLPEELGYIAFVESRFDPTAVNPRSRASGMWQLMEEVARKCGISAAPPDDERFDSGRSSDAAACYLSKLLAEYGQESFMLVLASYNRGENGVRRALHKLAKEPGGYRKRDFWHLYRLKLLPEETREYVPKVLAAAIVMGNPAKYGLASRTAENLKGRRGALERSPVP